MASARSEAEIAEFRTFLRTLAESEDDPTLGAAADTIEDLQAQIAAAEEHADNLGAHLSAEIQRGDEAEAERDALAAKLEEMRKALDRDLLEKTLALHFTQNRQPCMSGDPRDRLSPLQRRNLSDAVDAVQALVAAALSREEPHG